MQFIGDIANTLAIVTHHRVNALTLWGKLADKPFLLACQIAGDDAAFSVVIHDVSRTEDLVVNLLMDVVASQMVEDEVACNSEYHASGRFGLDDLSVFKQMEENVLCHILSFVCIVYFI